LLVAAASFSVRPSTPACAAAVSDDPQCSQGGRLSDSNCARILKPGKKRTETGVPGGIERPPADDSEGIVRSADEANDEGPLTVRARVNVRE